jgi:hypothetical protein
MNDARNENEMTNEEAIEAQISSGEIAYMDQMNCMRQCAPIRVDLDAALGAYIAALDDQKAKAAALNQFDAALARLREVYREFGYSWESYVEHPHLFQGIF